MATATAPAPKVEELKPVTPATPAKAEKETKRPRPNINYPPASFNSEAEANGKQPKLGAVTVTKGADGKEVETIDTAHALDAEGYRLCRVKHNASGKELYIWARTTDMALALVAASDYTSEFTDAKKRGRSAKADPVYVNFLKMLIKNKAVEDIKVFLTEYPNYRVFLADDLKTVGL